MTGRNIIMQGNSLTLEPLLITSQSSRLTFDGVLKPALNKHATIYFMLAPK